MSAGDSRVKVPAGSALLVETPLGTVLVTEAVPDNEVWIVSGDSLVKMTNVGKKEAIEPTSVEKMSKGYRFGVDMASGNDYSASFDHEFHPNPLMRRLGFTANPLTCSHYRKRYITRWFCADCGENL